jgi:RNA polymerase sigma factor (sigma-70 family)
MARTTVRRARERYRGPLDHAPLGHAMRKPLAATARLMRCDGAEMVARVWPDICRVVRCVLGAEDSDYADATQTAAEHLLATVYDAQFREGSLSQLAVVIARNVAVDIGRARARRMRTFVQDDEAAAAFAEAVGPERIASAREVLTQYGRALGALRVDNARVVYAHDVLGYELAEIATMFETSISAAQSRLWRGRDRVATVLRIPTSCMSTTAPIVRARPKRSDRTPWGPQLQRRRASPSDRRVRRHTSAGPPDGLPHDFGAPQPGGRCRVADAAFARKQSHERGVRAMNIDFHGMNGLQSRALGRVALGCLPVQTGKRGARS